uniref:Uncharacterized protein n=1 Tax=Arundo donax TaxID=35708 RepID=A0A0A8YCW0_ARUDO
MMGFEELDFFSNTLESCLSLY